LTVLDAFAVLAFLREEPAAEAVMELLRRPTLLSAANASEVVDQLVRVSGHQEDDVVADLALLERAGMSLVPVSAEVGVLAGQLRAQHYHRERAAVSLADCLAAATALSADRALATADPALANLIRAEGGVIHPLPDSRGRLP
jgi:ribonuclease VapC